MPLTVIRGGLPAAADPFRSALQRAGEPPELRAGAVSWLQVNVGKRCNQACHHCHVDAGPQRSESMDARTLDRVLAVLAASPEVELLDITGGAPELNPGFRRLAAAGRAMRRRVIDRCNLTILLEDGQEDLGEFLARERVDVVASMPCYLEENVDRQRGRGVYRKSVEALRRLNALGYGDGRSGLRLDLVYNPGGAFLPGAQGKLEAAYKQQLGERWGIVFDSLVTITNMPIARFAHDLERSEKRSDYEDLLEQSFNAATLPGLMCRSLVSVSWDGRLFDCDFNQMLELPLDEGVRPRTIWDLARLGELSRRPIATGAHCFGCTAGAGSSCSGAIAS
jgi:radical SAM/Cys-rich protein